MRAKASPAWRRRTRDVVGRVRPWVTGLVGLRDNVAEEGTAGDIKCGHPIGSDLQCARRPAINFRTLWFMTEICPGDADPSSLALSRVPSGETPGRGDLRSLRLGSLLLGDGTRTLEGSVASTWEGRREAGRLSHGGATGGANDDRGVRGARGVRERVGAPGWADAARLALALLREGSKRRGARHRHTRPARASPRTAHCRDRGRRR